MILLVLSLNLLKWKPTMAVDFNIMSIVQRNMMTPQEQAQSLFLRPTRNPEVTPVDDPTFTPIAVIPKPYEASTYGVPQEPKLQQELLYERSPLQEYKPVSFLETAAKAIIPSVETVANAIIPSAEASISDDSSFVMDIWGPYYQTDNSVSKNARALMSLQKDWSVPDSEKQAQELAAKVFEGDSGYSYNDILDFIGKIGQVESDYKVKEQQSDLEKGKKAWSYYQVEPKTALSLLTDSAALFGPKFEEAFKNYSMKGVSARQNLANRSKEAMADLLLKDSKLAAALATAKVIATTKKNK